MESYEFAKKSFICYAHLREGMTAESFKYFGNMSDEALKKLKEGGTDLFTSIMKDIDQVHREKQQN